MRVALALFLVIHGLIHLLGAAKAFSLADLPQLTQPISTVFGALWLVAALLFLSTAASLFLWPGAWRAMALGAVLVSSIVILRSWTDANAGSLANVIVLVTLRWPPN